MTEDKFESFLKKAAPSYNSPPERAPREEMWRAIQAARQAGPRVVYGGGANSVATSGSRFGSKVWLSAAAAAVLVATGVGIGRWTASPGTESTAASTVARTAAPDQVALEGPIKGDASGSERTVTTERGDSRAPGGRAFDRSTSVASGPSLRLDVASGGITASGNGVSGSASTAGATSPSAYQVAAVNHLTQAEALLTSFRTRSAADQRVDAQLASWARELLSNTRLLLDSPVAVDPQRRPLLQDLELLLVQIVQLSPGGTPQDREIIEHTLKQDQVLTRLRTAIPAGQRGS
ncbi:MAG TPA: hypothetical protein VNO75_05455 [Gemmatimonadaceae bacterium]|nr:hypothetical protein [Gemmatimonadaceae bacterium]